MTAVQSPPAPPTAIKRPRVVARTGLYAVLAANAAVVAYFFATAGFASNALIVLGRLAGEQKLLPRQILSKPYHFAPLIHTIQELAAGKAA